MYLLTLAQMYAIYLPISVRSTGQDPDSQDRIGKCVHVVRKPRRHDPVRRTATTYRYSRCVYRVFDTVDNMFCLRSDVRQGVGCQDRPGSYGRTVSKDKSICHESRQRLL